MRITNLYKNCAYGEVQLDISFAGCPHRCKGCYVPELQDPTNYPDWSKEYIFKEIEKLEPFVRGFVLLGGDPLFDPNVEDTIELVTHLKKYGKRITLLTGYTPDRLTGLRKMAADLCDRVLAGPYIQTDKPKQLGVSEWKF